MKKSTVYKGLRLMQDSKAYELWELAQKDHSFYAKLDKHLKENVTHNKVESNATK